MKVVQGTMKDPTKKRNPFATVVKKLPVQIIPNKKKIEALKKKHKNSEIDKEY